MGNSRKFLKVGIIYTIGQLLSKAVSFIMIPIYTRELGTSGFGQLSLVDTAMNFISTFLILSIYSGYIRFYREYEDDKRNRLRNTAITVALIATGVNLVFIIFGGKYISGFIFNFSNSYEILILLFLRSIISQFVTLLMCDYSLNYEAQKMVIIEFIMMILNMVFVIVFVVVKKEGIIGVYKGYIFGTVVILIYLILSQIRRFKFEFDKGMFKNMFKFSFGLIPCNLSGAILDLADRYFLSGYKGFGQTGIYSMGYKIGTLIDPIFVNPFKSIFTTFKFQVWKEKNSEGKFNNMFRAYHVIGCLIILGISFYSKILIKILSSDEYLIAANLVPLILYSYFLYGENEFFSLGIQLKNKTYITSFIMLIGGGVNIVLNILFIPKFGMYGAAVATLISYWIINIINTIISKRFHKVKYNYKIAYIIDGIALSIYIIYLALSNLFNNIIINGIAGIIMLALYIIIITVMKIISYDDIKLIIKRKC